MIGLGKGAPAAVHDIALTRYACYLIAQNGDPRKSEIAFAMNYFAVQTRKQELVEKRIAEFERVQARGKLSLSQKALSGLLFERGIDGAGFSRILSRGRRSPVRRTGHAGHEGAARRAGRRPLADFLPTITIKAKDFANEVTHMQVKQHDLREEPAITTEHVRSNADVRKILTDRKIRPEALPPGEDVRRVERRLRAEEKKLPRIGSGKPVTSNQR